MIKSNLSNLTGTEIAFLSKQSEQNHTLVMNYIHQDPSMSAAWDNATSNDRSIIFKDADIRIHRAIILGNDSPEFMAVKNAYNATPGGKAFTPQVTSAFIDCMQEQFEKYEFDEIKNNPGVHYSYNDSSATLRDTNGFGEQQIAILTQGLRDLSQQLVTAKNSLSGADWHHGGKQNFENHYVSPNDTNEIKSHRKKELISNIDEMQQDIQSILSNPNAYFVPFISEPTNANPSYGQTIKGEKIQISDRFWYETDPATVVGRLAHEFSHRISWNTNDHVGYGIQKNTNALDANQSEAVFNNADGFKFWLMKTPLPRRTSHDDDSKHAYANAIFTSEEQANTSNDDIQTLS